MKMTMTREEFIEFYHKYDEAVKWFNEHDDVLSDTVFDQMMSGYEIVIKALREDANEIFLDFYWDECFPIAGELDADGCMINPVYTSDVGVLYDTYFKGRENNN